MDLPRVGSLPKVIFKAQWNSFSAAGGLVVGHLSLLYKVQMLLCPSVHIFECKLLNRLGLAIRNSEPRNRTLESKEGSRCNGGG